MLREVSTFSLKFVKYLVFDEADRLFEMGFADQLNEVIRECPVERQVTYLPDLYAVLFVLCYNISPTAAYVRRFCSLQLCRNSWCSSAARGYATRS